MVKKNREIEMVSVKIEAICKETDKAILIRKDGLKHWVPKSNVTVRGDECIMPDWLLKRIDYQGAMFSDDHTRRFVLWRNWSKGPIACCVGLNPSTATENANDHTIRLLITALQELGYGGFRMCNLFTVISSTPDILLSQQSSEEEDLGIIFGQSLACNDIIFCWGAFEAVQERAKKVIEFFTEGKCFGKNKDGSPWHPRATHYAWGKQQKPVIFKFLDHRYEQNRYSDRSKRKKADRNEGQLKLIQDGVL